MEENAPLFPTREQLVNDLRRLLRGADVIQLPVANRARRPADDVWDACADALGWQPDPRDDQGKTRFGKLVRALVQMEATPSEIQRRARRYRTLYPTVAFTPEAFGKHWSSLAEPAPPPRAINITREADDEPRMTLAEWRRLHEASPEALDYLRRAGVYDAEHDP